MEFCLLLELQIIKSLYDAIFMNENNESDFNFSLNLTNGSQIYDTNMSKMSHQLRYDGTFVFTEVDDKDQVASKWTLQFKSKDGKNIYFQVSSIYKLHSALTLHFQTHFAYYRIMLNMLNIRQFIWLDKNHDFYNLRMNTYR